MPLFGRLTRLGQSRRALAAGAVFLAATVLVAWVVLSIARTPDRTPTGSAAAFSTFRAHVRGEAGKLNSLMTTYLAGAKSGKVAAVNMDAAAIRAWAMAEAAWLDTAQDEDCFANVFILWDAVREHADRSAADALAGEYQQAASESDTTMAVAKNAANAILAVVCP